MSCVPFSQIAPMACLLQQCQMLIIQRQNQETDMVQCVYSFVILSHAVLCNHYNQDTELFHHRKTLLCSHLCPYPPPLTSFLTLATTDLFSMFTCLSFRECDRNGIRVYRLRCWFFHSAYYPGGSIQFAACFHC